MKLQIASDLHLEFYENNINLDEIIIPSAPFLILAGDIGNPFHVNYQNFLLQCNEKFEKTFLIMGNHECYNSSIEESKIQIENVVKNLPNIIFLYDSYYDILNIRILGTILWSKIHPTEEYIIKSSISDYIKIYQDKDKTKGNITPQIINCFHQKHVNWLTSEIEKGKMDNQKLIIVTHHLPYFSLIPTLYQFARNNSSFASDLSYLFQEPIVFWICGHVHYRKTKKINDIPVYINALGYPDENTRFDKKLVIEC